MSYIDAHSSSRFDEQTYGFGSVFYAKVASVFGSSGSHNEGLFHGCSIGGSSPTASRPMAWCIFPVGSYLVSISRRGWFLSSSCMWLFDPRLFTPRCPHRIHPSFTSAHGILGPPIVHRQADGMPWFPSFLPRVLGLSPFVVSWFVPPSLPCGGPWVFLLLPPRASIHNRTDVGGRGGDAFAVVRIVHVCARHGIRTWEGCRWVETTIAALSQPTRAWCVVPSYHVGRTAAARHPPRLATTRSHAARGKERIGKIHAPAPLGGVLRSG